MKIHDLNLKFRRPGVVSLCWHHHCISDFLRHFPQVFEHIERSGKPFHPSFDLRGIKLHGKAAEAPPRRFSRILQLCKRFADDGCRKSRKWKSIWSWLSLWMEEERRTFTHRMNWHFYEKFGLKLNKFCLTLLNKIKSLIKSRCKKMVRMVRNNFTFH